MTDLPEGWDLLTGRPVADWTEREIAIGIGGTVRHLQRLVDAARKLRMPLEDSFELSVLTLLNELERPFPTHSVLEELVGGPLPDTVESDLEDDMSTTDVPGANPANGDELGMGCWAEHEDGSLVLVQSTEGGRVVFEMFDDLDKDPVTAYRHAMPVDEFNRAFSWEPGKVATNVKWTWHDKTPFPFDRIIKAGVRPGMRYASADDQLSAAARVAASLDARAEPRSKSELADLFDTLRKHPATREIIGGIQDAISRFVRK